MTKQLETNSEKDNKVCPFMYSGFFEPCIKEECMAWSGYCVRLKEDVILDVLEEIITWGNKFGDDTIKGYISARITHIKGEARRKGVP